MTRNPDEHRLSEAEHQAIFERDIKPDLFADAKPSSQPVAVIFGGQPGAGKSAGVDAAMTELGQRGGAVQIIGDDLRGYHPRYERLMKADDKTAAFYTDRDTGRWVEKAIAEAIYSNELQGGQWVREPQARAVVEAERARPMTLPECRDYAKGFDELADMLAKRERQASAEEVRKVADLQREAKAAVAAEVFRQESPEKAEQQRDPEH